MTAEDVQKTANQIAARIAKMLQTNWDAVARNGASDPKMHGSAKINFGVEISTLGTTNHTIKMTIPGRAVKDAATSTPSDAEFDGEYDEDPETM